MRRIINLLILSFLFTFTTAQVPTFTITGQVKDAKTRKPVSFASVIVLNSRDSALTMSITNEQGFFSLPLKYGNYKLLIKFLGYKNDTVNVTVNKDKFVGIIDLQPVSQNLQKVTVTATLRKQTIDKEEVVVTKQMRQRATNVNELLNQVNGISYDRYNNQISVDGDTKVLILVDGLEKSQTYIQSLNPQQIAKIEVIRDPSGRYGLEGYNAIINIILRTNYKGYDVSAFTNLVFIPMASSSRFVFGNSFNRFSLNLTKRKINFYAEGLGGFANFAVPMYLTREYTNGLLMRKEPYSQALYKMNYLHTTVGLDYKINPLNVVSFEYSLEDRPFSRSLEESFMKVRIFDNDSLVRQYDERGVNKNGSVGSSYSVFYHGHLNHNLNIISDLHFRKNSSDNAHTYFMNDYKYFSSLASSSSSEFEYNLDATYKLGKFKINVGGGYLADKMHFFTQQLISLDTIDYNQDYNYVKTMGYGYLTYYPFKQVSLKIGIAAQNYLMNYNDFKKSMTIYQPYLNLQVKPVKYFQMTLKYRVNTSYPSATQLNPAKTISEQGIVMQGNINLKPQSINRFALNLRLLMGLLTVEPYYEISHNYIVNIAKPTKSGVLFTYDNAGLYKNYGYKLDFMIPFGKKLIWKNSFNFYWSQINYQNIDNKIHDWRGSSQFIYYNPKLFTVGLMYQNMNSKMITALGYRSFNNDFIGLFAQKNFFHKTVSFTIFYVFPFKSVPGWLDYDQVTYTKTPVYAENIILDISEIRNLLVFNLNIRLSKGKVMKVNKPENKQQKQNTGGLLSF